MGKIKLLVTTGDFSQWISPNFHYLLEELVKMTDLTIWHKSGDVRDILEQLDSQPDFIFINEFGEKHSPQISGLQFLDIPYGVYLHDLHYDVHRRKEALIEDNVQHIFSYYRDKFYHWFPELSDRLRWLPHHVNTEIYKDYGLPREIDWLLMGATYSCYPLRNRMIEVMSGKLGFVNHKHPGYRNFGKNDDAKFFVGERYAQEINRAKMFLTCDSIFTYPLRKYYEALACKTLLLAPSSKELRDLGFIPGVHFVEVNKTDFLEKAEYYLTHENERKEIAEQGYKMVHTRHSTTNRAKQLVEIIHDIL